MKKISGLLLLMLLILLGLTFCTDPEPELEILDSNISIVIPAVEPDQDSIPIVPLDSIPIIIPDSIPIVIPDSVPIVIPDSIPVEPPDSVPVEPSDPVPVEPPDPVPVEPSDPVPVEPPDPVPDELPDPEPFIPPDITYGSVTDIEGNIYKTVEVGTQIWTVENLKTTTYNDGTLIDPGIGAPAGYTDWFALEKGAYCWYDNDPSVNKERGAIYNWHAVATGKLCPTGWHVPAYSEWTLLITNLGGEVDAFSSKTDNASIRWENSEINLNLKSCFNPAPGGCLDGWGFIPDFPYWWTGTPMDKYTFPYAYLASFYYMADEPQSYGFNVRCLKD
jgi:uncharacterized protein (TIGR02145 family)